MNALQLVDKLQEAEYRITHLKMILDHLSTEPDFKESAGVLVNILKDYQTHYDKTRQTLGNMEVHLNLNPSHHNQNQRQNGNHNQNQNQYPTQNHDFNQNQSQTDLLSN